MPETYSRVGALSLIKEVTANTALTPTTFIPFNSEGISSEYPYTPSMPISGTRAVNLRAIKNKIPAPTGNISFNVEPKTFGYILNGLYGGVTSGNYMTCNTFSGDFSVGSTITGSVSAKTATVVAHFNQEFILIDSPTGEFTDGETITESVVGNKTAVVVASNNSVYGHLGQAPVALDETYTVQKDYADRGVRYMGCRFHSLNALGQADNIVSADVTMTAQSEFRQARVTAVTVAAGGAQTITVDQTHGLVVADSIKLYRAGTGFLDFSAASVKTHAVATIPTTTTFTVTGLETSTAVGDLILLAPLTPSYTIDEEFCWIGGATANIGDDVDNLSAFDCQDFTMIVENELEPRHAATGTDFEDRFPSDILQKGFTGGGTFVLHNENENYYRHLRVNTAQAIDVDLVGNQIGSTGMYYEFRSLYPEVQFDAYQLSLAQEDVVNEEVPFTSFYNTSLGCSHVALLVNDVASY